MPRNGYLLLIVINILISCSSSAKKANSLVYFIGDGMGPTQITGARIFKGGSQAKLNLEDFEYTGFSKTYSSDNFVTDSAASGTALASGVKTYNGSIGKTDKRLDPKKEHRDLETITDLAQKEGKSIGIISTASITHATPASFYAHVQNRGMENVIAMQLFNSTYDLFLGGGRGFFIGSSTVDGESGDKGKRTDQLNLVEAFKKQDKIYIEKKSEFDKLDPKSKKKIVGLFNYSHLEFEALRKADKWGEPSLSEMVSFAVKYLSKNPKGYMLIVESGRVDHASHDNRAKLVFTDMIEFDHALGVAMKEVSKDTLIVMTADHETGGLALSGYGSTKQVQGDVLLGNQVFFDGSVNEKETYINWASGPGGASSHKVDTKDPYFQHKATLETSSAKHTAVDVMVGAKGPGAEKFTGYMENYKIPRKISEAMGLKFESKVNLENFKIFK